MSSPDRPGRHLLRILGAALLCVALSACFRPLYGPTASGALMQDVLASIEVDEIKTPIGQERIGHDLRSELVYLLNGSGEKRPARYRLASTLSESIQTPIIDSVTGRADTATLVVAITYTLTTLDGKVVTTGTSRGTANYNRDSQRFASVRAARDADKRVGTMIAEEIRTRLASILSVAP